MSTESEIGFTERRRSNVRNGRWKLNSTRGRRRGRIGGRDQRILGASTSREGRGHISKPPLYFVLQYMAPLVLQLVALRYEGKTEGLFEKNPVPTWCFLVSIGVYGLIIVGMEQTQTPERCFQILKHLALISAVLAIVSLVSVFLPCPMSIVPLIICTSMMSVALAWPTLYNACSLIHTGIKGVLANIRAKLGNLTQEASLPQ